MGVSKTDENSKTTKISAIDIIREAIKTTGLPRKGASFVNIRKFALEFDENADPKRQVRSLKLALKKGLDSGILIRPNHCKNSVGATGSFLLGKKLPAKMTKESKKSIDPDMEPEAPQKKSKEAKKPAKSSEKKTKDQEKKPKVPAKKAPQKTAKGPEKASKTSKKKSKDAENVSEDLAQISKATEKSKNPVKKTKAPEKSKAAVKESKAVEKKPKAGTKESKVMEKSQAVTKESKVMEKKTKDQEKKSKVEVTKATEKNTAKGKNPKASKNSKTVDEPTSSKVTPKTSDKVKVVMKAKRTNNVSKQESDFPDTPKISVPPSKGNHSIRLLSATGSKRPAIAYTFRPSISIVVQSGKKILKKYAKMRVQRGLPGTDADETKIQKPKKAVSDKTTKADNPKAAVDETKIQKPKKAVSDKTTKADNPKAAVKPGKNAKSKKAVAAVESSSQGMKKVANSKNEVKKLYSTPVTSNNRLGVFDPEHDASLIGPQQTKLVFSESDSDTEEYIEEKKGGKVKKNISDTESSDTEGYIEKNKGAKVKKNISDTESSDTDGYIEENEGPKVKKNRSSIETGYASLDTEIVAKKNKRHERPKVSVSDTELTFVKSDTVSTKQKKTGKVQAQKKATKKTKK